MIRCRCGIVTNFGLTCSRCASNNWDSSYSSGDYVEEEYEEPYEEYEIETTSLDELEPPEED